MLPVMQTTGRWWPIWLAAMLGAAVLVVANPDAPAMGVPTAQMLPNMLTTAAADQPIEKQIGGMTKTVLRGFRQSLHLMVRGVQRTVQWWSGSLERAIFSLGVAIIAALADAGLINTWRSSGFRTAVAYSRMMLYVYARLFVSRGVSFAPKLLLVGALVYGAMRQDFIPDRETVPGRLDDILLIVIATWTFIYSCPESLVSEYAGRAINLKGRLLPFSFRSR
jgi:uncharacterized membrane protein YkvA (DUF1232 family)